MTGDHATRGSSPVVLQPGRLFVVFSSVFAAAFAAFLLFVAGAVAFDPVEDPATRRWLPVVLVLGALPAIVAAVRLPGMRVVADEDGVVERAIFRKRRWTWDDIEGIDVGPSLQSQVPRTAVWLRLRRARSRCLLATARIRTTQGDASVAEAHQALIGHPGFHGTAVVPPPADDAERRRALRSTAVTGVACVAAPTVMLIVQLTKDSPPSPFADPARRDEGECYELVEFTGPQRRDPGEIGYVTDVDCESPHLGEVAHIEERGPSDGLATIEERCDAAVPLPSDSPFVVRHQTLVDDGRLRIVCAVERADGALTTGHADLDAG